MSRAANGQFVAGCDVGPRFQPGNDAGRTTWFAPGNNRWQYRHPDTVELEPLREVFARRQAEGWTIAEVARSAGMDWTQCARYLGRSRYHRKGRAYDVLTATYDNAVRLAKALGADPVDVGL